MKSRLLITLLLFVSFGVGAQIYQPQFSTPSPNAASLGEFGRVPVSHFTGVPSVTVPLHEIEVGDFKYPITLAYHLSSVKPNAQPGSVGLGWSLLADACITRTVRGVYDEKMGYGNNEHGYYGHRAKMQGINAEDFLDYTNEGLESSISNSDWY